MAMPTHFMPWDWMVLAVFGLSIAFGLFRGLVRTVFALAGWVVALIGTPLAMAWLTPWLPDGLPPPVLAIAIFIGLLIGMRLLGGLAARALHGVGLGGLDRVLGGAIGAARALIIVLIVALLGHLAGLSRQPEWQQAWSRPLLDVLVQWAEPFLPERVSGVQQT